MPENVSQTAPLKPYRPGPMSPWQREELHKVASPGLVIQKCLHKLPNTRSTRYSVKVPSATLISASSGGLARGPRSGVDTPQSE